MKLKPIPHADMRPKKLAGRSQERENRLFERLLRKYGAFELEDRIHRLESYRKFIRRYPYDFWSKRASMDAIDLTLPTDPLGELVAAEAREELLDGLTEREQWVAQRAEEGYKPRDMAELRGAANSGADRWIKHSIKVKFEDRAGERVSP